uniref:Ion transport domain-containing protein n=1 Tax=Octopus bimaculoides TaxID=37653 RepID=A0A0L8GKX3_OCTBM
MCVIVSVCVCNALMLNTETYPDLIDSLITTIMILSLFELIQQSCASFHH